MVRSRSERCTPLIVGLLAILAVSGCGGSSRDLADSPSCGEISGRTVDVELEGERTTGRPALVHLPPCYDSADGVYRTVYLLHGAGMTPETWMSPPIRLDDRADELMLDAEIDPLIIVLSPRSTMSSGFPDTILDPLMIAVDTRYRTVDATGSDAMSRRSPTGWGESG